MAQPESGLHVAALSYSEQGWPLFPCWWIRDRGVCACVSRECSHLGKHPLGLAAPGGCTNATTDGKRGESWWTSWPLADVAIAIGLELRLVVPVRERAETP
ncbi:MAG: bifunctional DNA primase/polymerase [Deltaproteobacteria bacterium]|nr:bifunctional DNA primase/polymerase [Deltaproteobacteria bacterium]